MEEGEREKESLLNKIECESWEMGEMIWALPVLLSSAGPCQEPPVSRNHVQSEGFELEDFCALEFQLVHSAGSGGDTVLYVRH